MPPSSSETCLVIGLGSIGERHARLLRGRGHRVAVVSRRDGADYRTIAAAVRAEAPGYAVICTETADHARAITELAAASFTGRLNVEKPLFARPQPIPADSFASVHVAYLLRCHPALRRLKDWLGDTEVLSAQIYVGQYLPDWRPGRDYRQTASASTAAGGGVLRDLSHELDYAHWLLGPWTRLTALGGHWSTLEIDADDTFVILSEHARCRAATLHLNYLDRRLRRQIVLNTADHSFELDLIAGTLRRDGDEPEFFAPDRDAMIERMHDEILAGGTDHLASLADGMAVMAMMAAAERAAAGAGWIAAEGEAS